MVRGPMIDLEEELSARLMRQLSRTLKTWFRTKVTMSKRLRNRKAQAASSILSIPLSL